MPEMKQVHSSHIESIGYDDTGLHVEYKNGSQVVYKDVPSNIAKDIMSSWSVGSSLKLLVKGSYEHEYVRKGSKDQ